MFEFYNEIVNGFITPHSINESNLNGVNNAFFHRKDGVIASEEFIEACTRNYGAIDITEDKETGKATITLIPDEKLQQLININIPPPPDEKAEIYETLIQFEFEIIKIKVNNFIKASNDIKNIELFGFKNLQILKELAKDLQVYILKLGGVHGNLFLIDSNHFVTYVLKYYLVETIQYIQEILSTFINFEVDSEIKLLYELFNETIPRVPYFKILALLPLEKEFQDFRNEFLKSKEDVSIGESLFVFYKKKNKNLKKDEQISNYQKTIQFWNELLITNKLKVIVFDKYQNEPEIEQILLPLIFNEINVIVNIKNENEFNKLNIKHRETYGVEIPFGGFLFDEIKKEAEKLKEKSIQINFYKEKLYYWTELSLTDSEIISEPEIKERLLPLIENKIKSLQNNDTLITTNLNGFKSYFKPQQIEMLFEQLKGSYIDVNVNSEHFKAIFKDEMLQNNCKIKWLKSNVLLSYIIKKLFHKENCFDLWVKAEKIFINSNNVPIKNLRKSESNNPLPVGFEQIDSIIDNMDTH